MTETQSRNLWFTILWGLWCGFEKLEKLKISVADSANRRQRIELIYLKNIPHLRQAVVNLSLAQNFHTEIRRIELKS